MSVVISNITIYVNIPVYSLNYHILRQPIEKQHYQMPCECNLAGLKTFTAFNFKSFSKSAFFLCQLEPADWRSSKGMS